ncbi:MAG: HU family DNA-binding protein [Bacteroidales bacterium]|jgi:DNA-binding protein HU-beta|uniref:DNA-binding protein HU n=1 Tax=bioreactor metagenome TaxID=1076179 RepID=A0A644UL62_9ZZZZ|nr:HU family DNA-binding protein [Bacteroidales bacterium]MEA4967226.1 HU family DNA-binding protein [Bacteroidaceae bacterium]NCC17392.1 HU family DNA-binding protein [Bacteroidia bacterium]MDD2530297.1 HU family DNA-binding protein [Bacteroidales bacterium]MDD2576371.1 HU family DNA-binding protein [Bacteroidales bacterium]
MTKKDFIHLMSAKADLNLKQSGAAYDAFLKVIEEKLKAGEKVSFIGFGSFNVVDKPARTARNPRTGKAIKVAAKKVVKFRPGSGLKTLKKGKK